MKNSFILGNDFSFLLELVIFNCLTTILARSLLYVLEIKGVKNNIHFCSLETYFKGSIKVER